MTPRAKAIAEASRLFRTTRGYSELWDALVELLEYRYRAEAKALHEGSNATQQQD